MIDPNTVKEIRRWEREQRFLGVINLIMGIVFGYIVPYGIVTIGGGALLYILYLGLFHSHSCG